MKTFISVISVLFRSLIIAFMSYLLSPGMALVDDAEGAIFNLEYLSVFFLWLSVSVLVGGAFCLATSYWYLRRASDMSSRWEWVNQGLLAASDVITFGMLFYHFWGWFYGWY